MDSSLSFKRLLVQSLLFLTPSLALAQSPLSACLTDAGVRNIVDTDSTWATEITPWQLRLRTEVDPAAMAYPTDKVQLASSLACARNASVKVSALAGGHSFAAYGMGNPGDLVVNMAAFNSVVGSSIGGGFGSTSRYLGTPMDAIHSVEYMLYNGTLVNATAGSDLLFATKGAASSYGILTSLTTKTWKPKHANAVNYTLTFGNIGIEDAVKAFLSSQEFAMSEAPDELALRWALSLTPFSATGYYYGNPANFDAVMKPLMNRFTINATLTKSEFDFWTMETFVATGANLPNGGASAGRSFYTQALTTTTDAPLTADLTRVLFQRTILDFNRTDLRRSGLLDLWGGVSRDLSDADTAYAHGSNLWLIRFDTNLPTATNPYPADGVAYAQSIMKPFEDALVGADIPLRGFANYRDTGLTEAQWSERLYGEQNYAKLKAIKRVYDPEGLFTSNKQSIA
ncbi:FAD binding domain-containing protein [Leptodontidium sp. 2 PMI_412]|nr:FAD binding domain-containing protein [Leptodontidium sp. 2 PMI_412]